MILGENKTENVQILKLTQIDFFYHWRSLTATVPNGNMKSRMQVQFAFSFLC